MIIKEHKAIFIHIPKCAGSSIENKFGKDKNSEADHSRILDLITISPMHLPEILLKNTSDLEVFKRAVGSIIKPSVIYKKDFNNYYKFTFVRNPWSRVVSFYHFITVIRKNYATIENISPLISFDNFVVNHLNIWDLKPQYWWLTNGRDISSLDFIGKFENLQPDFEHIVN